MRLIMLSFIILLTGCPKKAEAPEEKFYRYNLEEFDQLMDIDEEEIYDLPEAIDEPFDDTGDPVE